MEIRRAEIKYLCHVNLFGFPFYQSKCVLCILVNVFLSNNQRTFQSLFHLWENKLLVFSQIDVIYISALFMLLLCFAHTYKRSRLFVD